MNGLLNILFSCMPESNQSWATNISDVDELIKDFYDLNDIDSPKSFEAEEVLAKSILERCNKYENEIIAIVEEGKCKDIPIGHRQAFGASSLIKAHTTLRKYDDVSLEVAISTLDKALLIAMPANGWNVLEAINMIHEKLGESRYYSNDRRTLVNCQYGGDGEEISSDNDDDRELRSGLQSLNFSDDIVVEESPSLQTFIDDYLSKDEPVKILNGMVGWAALVKWKYFGYLKRMAGVRIVPIELGDYSRGGRIRLVSLADYLDELGQNKTAEEIGYLAQHPLFEQEPRLLKDIIVPAYCACSDADDMMMNVWLGPSKTLTPIHWDPNHNILAQVVGKKKITLFAPTDSKYLYPRTDSLHNTSQVDIRSPDYKKFPEYTNAVPLICTLEPGDMIFIPAGWWHAVESLDISFSVNFFF